MKLSKMQLEEGDPPSSNRSIPDSCQPTNSKKDMANNIEASKETIKIVPSTNTVKQVIKQIMSVNWQLEIFIKLNPFRSLCVQVLLISPIQELERLADVPSKKKMLVLYLAIRPTSTKILSFLLKVSSPTLAISPVVPNCRNPMIRINEDWIEEALLMTTKIPKLKDDLMQLNWSLWESEKFHPSRH